MCKGPDPYLDVVLQSRTVFAREGGRNGDILKKNYYYYNFNSKEKK